MNYLAHLYLAPPDEDALLGALLGDFVTGSDLSAWATDVQREIRLHRHIDSYTDAHPEVQALRSLFPQGQRRFAGIALDVHFDHLLARDWAEYSSQPLAAFCQRVYALLLRRLPELPPRLQTLAPPMASGDWLSGYRQRASVDRALSVMAGRLPRGGAELIALLPRLGEHGERIEAGFKAFFPELRREVAHARQRLQASGWR